MAKTKFGRYNKIARKARRAGDIAHTVGAIGRIFTSSFGPSAKYNRAFNYLIKGGGSLSRLPTVSTTLALAGGAAGAAVGWPETGGYIGGVIGDAVEGWVEQDVPEKKANMVFGKKWNSHAKKATMHRAYRKNGKLRGNTKDVYVSRKLREKVKEVIQDEKAHGAHYRREQYAIGFYATGGVPGGTTATDQKTAMDGLSTQYLTLLLPQESNFRQQWWGAGGISGAPSGLVLDNALYNSRNWIFFTPNQILDAASQLFNNKPLNPDYNIQAKNITTVVNTATGVPETVFKNQGLKLEIETAYVELEIRNCAERPMIIDFYHCIQKEKFQQNTPLTDFIDAVEGGGWVDTPLSARTATNRVYIPPVVGASSLTVAATKHYALGSGLMEPNQVGGFSNLWKYEKVTIIAQPGEICTHKIQGPRNYTLDYNKLYPGFENVQNDLFKDTTICLMAKVRTDFMYGTNGVVPTPADLTVNGKGPFTINNKIDELTQPIVINSVQVIKLKCPDVSGLTLQNPGDVDQGQTLNMKVPRKVFMDTSNYRKGELTYIFSNEENPVADRTQAQVGIYG